MNLNQAKLECENELAKVQAVDNAAQLEIEVAEYRAKRETELEDEKTAKITEIQMDIAVLTKMIARIPPEPIAQEVPVEDIPADKLAEV